MQNEYLPTYVTKGLDFTGVIFREIQYAYMIKFSQSRTQVEENGKFRI